MTVPHISRQFARDCRIAATTRVTRFQQVFMVVAVVWLVAATPLAMAQTPPAAVISTPLPTPDQSQAVPLRDAPGGSMQPEQWEHFLDQRVVRNVVAPNLMPVLPDPAKATGAAVIVAPGGGFLFLSMDTEGYQVAHWLADHGVAAFVLKYRTRETPRDSKAFPAAFFDLLKSAGSAKTPAIGTPPEALEDAEAAIKLVRARAKEWRIDPARVGFVGFSAGAMTALDVGLIDDPRARPDFIAPIYGPLNARPVSADAPPMFMAVALDDPLMAMGKSIGLIDSWRNAHRPIEVHLYEHGGHGFGMTARRPASAMWIDEFYAWMADRGLLKPAG